MNNPKNSSPSSKKNPRLWGLTLNPHLISVLFLGLSSGLPFALSGSTLQAWFASENVNIITIGLLSLVTQPYVYKVLWAPFLDRYIPLPLGRRRSWIFLMQIALAGTLALMAIFGHPKSHAMTLALLALLLSFFSATQDISIDAYRTDILKPVERALGSAFYVATYRLALILSGGLALIFADHYGWKNTYLFMAVIMGFTSIITLFSKEPDAITALPTSLKQAMIEPLKEFLSRPFAKWGICFLFFYKFGDAFTVSLTSVFLIKHLHFSLSIVGSVNKIIGIISAILGGIFGGILFARLGLYRSLFYFGMGQALCSFLFMMLAIAGKNIALLAITIFADNFLGGMSTVTFLAFITGLCDKRFSASQFALFSVISSLPRVFIGPLAAWIVQSIGWSNFFFISFFTSLPSLWLLWMVRNSYDAFNKKPQEL